MRRLGRSACALALAAASPAPVSSAQSRPVFHVDVDVVNLTATVLDGEGRLITDLGPGDFRIKEDGAPQRISVFGRAHEPGQDEIMALDLGMLFDTSQSMLGELKLSQQAAVRFLDSIPRARDLITVFFDQDIRISRYNSENQQGLVERIHEAQGGGNTALYDSIAVYLSRIRDSPGRKVLVLFSDGEDSTSTLGLADVVEMLRASPVTVYVIGFSAGLGTGTRRHLAANSVLHQFAALTGGVVFNPTGGRDLAAIYQRILDDLGNQYVLGFSSTNAARDGKYRRLKVELNSHPKGWKVRHRAGYYAPFAGAAVSGK